MALEPERADICHRGVLVGGLRKHVQLTQEDIRLISECKQGDNSTFLEQNHEVSEVAFTFRSMLKPKQCIANQGLLYRVGEMAILDVAGVENVAEIISFLSVKIGNVFEKFVKVLLHPYVENEDELSLQTDTGYKIISKLTTQQQLLIAFETAILRKVILYPAAGDLHYYFVVDYQRKKLPDFPIIVPFYPRKDDMVLIEGSDPEPWLAKVVSVDESQKSVHALYYELSSTGNDNCKFYKPSRHLRDTVSWNSIIRLADGNWSGSTWACY